MKPIRNGRAVGASDANAGRHQELGSHPRNLFAEPFGCRRRLGHRDVRQKHRELIASVSERLSTAPDDCLNRSSDCVETSIAFLMAAAIVHPLEPIEVRKDDSDQIAVRKRMTDLLLES